MIISKPAHQWLAPAVAATLLMFSGWASAQNYDAALERGSRPDTTAEQRYQTAIREAGGGLKVALAECKDQAADRKACEREARQNYKSDMEYARNLRRNPDARPTQVQGDAIISTEVTTFREIPAK